MLKFTLSVTLLYALGLSWYYWGDEVTALASGPIAATG